MSNQVSSAGATYPRAALVKRAIRSVRASGVDVASIEFRPDGTLRLSSNAAPAGSETDFDRWNAAGLL